MLVEPAAVDLGDTVEVGDVVGGEEGREDVADKPTDGVLSEDVEGVVDTEDELELSGVLRSVSSLSRNGGLF